MIIHITGRLGKTKAEPERAVVDVGEPVEWSVEVSAGPRAVPLVTWEVYFGHESPFDQRSWRVESKIVGRRRKWPLRKRWRDKNKNVYRAKITAGEANEPGEYKYGVRAFSSSPETPLSDDDPYIVVRRR
jgi:hypothetical protein